MKNSKTAMKNSKTAMKIGTARPWEPSEMALLCYAGARMGDAERWQQNDRWNEGVSSILAPPTPLREYVSEPIAPKQARVRRLLKKGYLRRNAEIASDAGVSFNMVMKYRALMVAEGIIPATTWCHSTRQMVLIERARSVGDAA